MYWILWMIFWGPWNSLSVVIVPSNLCKGISLSFQMKLKSFDLLFPTFPRCFPWLRLKRLVFLHFVKLCALKNVGDTFLPISYCCAFGGCEEKSLSHSGKTFLHFFFEIAFPGGHYDIWKDKKQQILILLHFVCNVNKRVFGLIWASTYQKLGLTYSKSLKMTQIGINSFSICDL